MINKKELYLRIKNLKEGEDKKVKDLLTTNGVEYKEYSTPTEMMCWEEAAECLSEACKDSMNENDKQQFINKYEDELTNRLYTPPDKIMDTAKCVYLLYTHDFLNTKAKELTNLDVQLGNCNGCGEPIFTSTKTNEDNEYICPDCGYENTLEDLY